RIGTPRREPCRVRRAPRALAAHRHASRVGHSLARATVDRCAMPSPVAVKQCARCGRAFGTGAAYQLQTPEGLAHSCLRCALLQAPMLRRSGVIALIVGTILTAINQGDALLAGHWAPALAWKLPLTYVVPFVVATLGALGTSKLADR